MQAGGHSRAAALAEQREIDFLRLLRNVPAITEVRHLDLAGKEQLRTSRLALDAVDSGKDYCRLARVRRGEIEKDLFQPGLLQERVRAVHHDCRGAGRDCGRGDGGRSQHQGDLGRGGAHRHGARRQCVCGGFERPAHRPSRSAARAGEARPLRRAAGQGRPGAARRRRAGRADVHDCRGLAGRPGARRACGDSGARLARVHRAAGRGYFRPAARRDGAQRRRAGVGSSARDPGERRAGPQDGRADPSFAGRCGARRQGRPRSSYRHPHRATSSRRLPTSSTAPPHGCRIRRAISSKRSRRVPRRSRARSKKCTRSAKSAGRSARRWTSRPCW